jgi:hypothetical protein
MKVQTGIKAGSQGGLETTRSHTKPVGKGA